MFVLEIRVISTIKEKRCIKKQNHPMTTLKEETCRKTSQKDQFQAQRLKDEMNYLKRKYGDLGYDGDDLTEMSVTLKYDWARVETAGTSVAIAGAGGSEFFGV